MKCISTIYPAIAKNMEIQLGSTTVSQYVKAIIMPKFQQYQTHFIAL